MLLDVYKRQVSKEIQGRVVDEQGEALIGVNVSINGGSGGTITNLNGDFTIRVTLSLIHI